MFTSSEIRWFCPGEPDGELEQWIARGGLGLAEAERIDRYLLFPGCDSVGVKIRQGRLEIKARTGALPQRLDVAKAVSGFRDSWVKWSRQAPDPGSLGALISSPDDDWMFVSKRRRLRKFVIAGESLQELAASDFPVQGVQVELSAIRVTGGQFEDADAAAARLRAADPWWSLSLEAFGPGEANLDNVLAAGHWLFERVPGVSLDSGSSCAYPAWLLERHAAAAPAGNGRP